MRNYLATMLFLIIWLSIGVKGQTEKKSMNLDEYIAESKIIVIAKCVSLQPVKANLTVDGEVEVLYVIKGEVKPHTKLGLTTRFYLEVGKTYLLRDRLNHKAEEGLSINEITAVVPFSERENLTEFATLPVRIQVLRTFNLRKDYLDSEIRRLTYEREALESLK